jgi:polar amino acid transport system permease protein
MYQFDWSVIPPILPLLLKGLELTLKISATVIVVSMIIAIPLAFARSSKVAFIRWPAQMYIEIFRGTPLLVQLIWVYYALPVVLRITLPAFTSVVLALSGNLIAFMAEAYRAGLQSVPKEHIEAGQVLGLSRFNIMRYVIVPQAFLQQIPVILSLNVSLFKDTSLVSALGVPDLTYQGNIQSSELFRPMEIYSAVALVYFAVAFPATLLTSYMERRIIARQEGTGAPSSGRISWETVLLKTIPLNLTRRG